MDFARTVLNIPVPHVHAWSSEPTEVGADFIIHEMPPGMNLSRVWAEVPRKVSPQLAYVSQQINAMDQKFLDNPLSSYGSMFYKKDIEGLPQEPLWPNGKWGEASEKFVVGPMMSWEFCRGERAKMEVDRGPCRWLEITFSQTTLIRTPGKDPAAYITGLIRSEQE